MTQLKCRSLLIASLVELGCAVTALASSASPVDWKPLYEPGGGGALVSLRVSPHDSNLIVSAGDMLSAARSADAGESWSGTFGFSTYEMADVTFHPTEPRVVWIGSMAGAFRSEDGGTTFLARRTGMPAPSDDRYTAAIERVVFDPSNPSRLLAIGGSSRRWAECESFGYVWESVDAGDTWHHLTTVLPGGSKPVDSRGVNLIAIEFAGRSGQKVVALGADTGVFVSADGGKTFAPSDQGLPHANVRRLAVHPKDENTMWVSLSANKRPDAALHEPGGVYKSTDGGKTWASISAGLPQDSSDNYHFTSNYDALAVSPVNPDVIWTNDARWNTGTIYKTEDGGATWKAVATRGNLGHDDSGRPDASLIQNAYRVSVATPAGCSLTGMTADPNDVDTAYGFGTEFILRTRDGGKTWQDITAMQPGPSRPDAWRGRGFNGWCASEVRFNPFRPGQLVVQMMDAGRAWVSDDDGHSWTFAKSDTHPWLGGNAVTFARDGTIYGTTGNHGQVNGISRSRDGGKTWTSLGGPEHGLPPKGWNSPGWMGGIHVHPDRSNDVWAVINGVVMHSADHGESWKGITDAKFAAIEPDPTDADRFYLSAQDGAYVTRDGATFTNIGGPKPPNRSKIHVDSRGRLYVTQWRSGLAGLWRYDPADKSWTRLLDEPLTFDVASDPKDPTRLALVTSMDPYHDNASGNGVWFSHDDGRRWSQEVQSLPMLRATCVEFDPKNGARVIVGTFGRGFFEASWPRDYKPAGTRKYVATAQDAAHAEVPPAGHMVVDFGPTSFDYAYGESWKLGDTVSAQASAVTVNATEHGGAGLVLNGKDLAPGGETKLVVRLRTLEGNAADRLVVNLNGLPDGQASIALTLPAPAETFADVSADLPAGKKLTVDQIQIQGTNFTDQARPVRVMIDSIRTIRPADAKPDAGKSTKIDDNKPAEPTTRAATVSTKPPLRNSDFEQGDAQPWNWEASGGATIARDTDVFAEGKASMRVTIAQGDGHGLQRLDLKAGDVVTLSGQLRTRGEVKANACVMSFKPNFNFIRFDQMQYAQNDTDWAKFEKTITLPEETDFCQIGVMVQGSGTAWIDGLVLKVNGVETAGPGIAPPVETGAVAAPKGAPNTPGQGFWRDHPTAWNGVFKSQLERAQQGNVDVVLIGDSITEGWRDTTQGRWKQTLPELTTINFGIGGDSTRQVLFRINNGLLDGYKPKLVVLMIGTNNLYDDNNAGSDEQIAQGIEACVKLIREKQPEAKVLLLSILPRQNDYFMGRIDRVNAQIAKLGDDRWVYYRDLTSVFKDAPGRVKKDLYAPDELHLSDAGYDAYIESLKPELAKLVK